MTTSFVITGFGPFGGVEENPTTVIVRRLDSYLRSTESPYNGPDESGDEIRNSNGDNSNGHNASHKPAGDLFVADLVEEYVVLETSAEGVNETMDRIRTDYIKAHPATTMTASRKETNGRKRLLLLHLGVGRSESFRLESCAYNEATFRIPDQKGYQPNEEPIVSNPLHKIGQCYKTSIDLEGLQKQMERDFPGVATVISTDPGRFVCNYVYCKSLEVSLPYSTQNLPQTPAVVSEEKTDSNITIDGDNSSSSSINNVDGDINLLCDSLFLHVPHFAIVPEEEQLAYVACLLKNLAAQSR